MFCFWAGGPWEKKNSSIFRIFTSSPSQNTFVLISLVDSIKNGKEDTVYQEQKYSCTNMLTPKLIPLVGLACVSIGVSLKKFEKTW